MGGCPQITTLTEMRNTLPQRHRKDRDKGRKKLRKRHKGTGKESEAERQIGRQKGT